MEYLIDVKYDKYMIILLINIIHCNTPSYHCYIINFLETMYFAHKYTENQLAD